MTALTADEHFENALAALTSLRKSSTGGTGLVAPVAVTAFAKAATVDAAAPGSLAQVARQLQLSHRVATLQKDAIVNGALDFVKAAARTTNAHARATELAKAAGTPAPSIEQVERELQRRRDIGPRSMRGSI
jgi:hypothetical protein